MKRIFAILMVALLMVSVIVVMTGSAFAAHAITTQNGKVVPGQNPCDNPCKDGPGGLERRSGPPQ